MKLIKLNQVQKDIVEFIKSSKASDVITIKSIVLATGIEERAVKDTLDFLIMKRQIVVNNGVYDLAAL